MPDIFDHIDNIEKYESLSNITLFIIVALQVKIRPVFELCIFNGMLRPSGFGE